MLKAYNSRHGVVFSLTIALLAYIPRLIRLDIKQFVFIEALLFLSILVCWFIHHFFLLYGFRKFFGKSPVIRTVTSIITGLLVVFLINNLFGNNTGSYWSNTAGLTENQALMINLFRSSVISGFCYFVVYYLQVNIRLQNSTLENEYLKQDQLKAQLFSLQQQLSPHFLFNSLSTLKTIAPDNETKTYVMQLANVYRYLLSFHDHQRITVKAELDFVKSYLYILQERFEKALQISIRIGESFLGYYMPPLTMQILVENALKHNEVSMDKPLYLRIYTDDSGSLTVENSYQPKLSIEESNGKGLQNINDRYRLLAGRQIDVCQKEGLFIVTLPLLMP
jgi:two-component system LytT family sensor kinase